MAGEGQGSGNDENRAVRDNKEGPQDPRLGFVLITDVELKQRYEPAKVFVSIYGSEERRLSMQALESAKGLYCY